MNERDTELARSWFRKAESDLLSVRNNLAAAEVPTDVVCFHCQQAAEKYLKGFLAWHAVPFGRTHDFVELVTLVARIAPTFAGMRKPAELLTDYAVDVRYPDVTVDEPTIDDAREALAAANTVREHVRATLGVS